MRTKWNGWGDSEKSFSLSERPGLQRYLSDKLGIYYFVPFPALTLDEITLTSTRMTDAARSDLTAIVGGENMRADAEARVAHSVGKSYEDLVVARRGEMPHLADAVLFPGGAREIREILAWAADNSVAVIPFGGGTGVAGGIEPRRALDQELAITLDLERLGKILFLDEKSLTAKIEPGMRGPVLEECLQAQGFSLGHYPLSFEYSTLGGWIATRSRSSFADRDGGKIEDLVLGLNVETPAGPLDISATPARSAGPEMRELILGSEGCLGIITLAEMRLHRKPEARKTLAYLLPSFEAGTDALREIVQQDFRITGVRLFDEEEVETNRALQRHSFGLAKTLRRGLDRLVFERRGLGRPAMLLLGFQGTRQRVAQDCREVARFLDARNSFDLGDGPGRDFYRDRFFLPYMRDALMDIGVLAETFETSVSWAGASRLHSKVRSALGKACGDSGARCIVNAQISHAYSSGAALTFTLLAPVGQGEELRLWRTCKVAATEAILRGGGTLSHRHGIGSMHREWMMQEHGPLGVAAIKALKETLDPAGILNPGKLLP